MRNVVVTGLIPPAIQPVNADGSSKISVVVDVLVRQVMDESPGDKILKDMFGCTKTRIPLSVQCNTDLDLTKCPLIPVEGNALFDVTRASRDGDAPPTVARTRGR